MIEPITTITAISLLAAYFKGAAQEAGKQSVDGLSSQARTVLRRLHDLVSRRLSGDEYSRQTLARLQERPDDEQRRQALQGVLAETAADDPTFARDLLAAVREADGQHGITISNSGAVAIGGSVVQTGTTVAGRDVRIAPATEQDPDGP